MEKWIDFFNSFTTSVEYCCEIDHELTARTNIQGTHLLVFSKYLFALWNTAIMLFQLELDWLDWLKIGCGLLLETNDGRWIF